MAQFIPTIELSWRNFTLMRHIKLNNLNNHSQRISFGARFEKSSCCIGSKLSLGPKPSEVVWVLWTKDLPHMSLDKHTSQYILWASELMILTVVDLHRWKTAIALTEKTYNLFSWNVHSFMMSPCRAQIWQNLNMSWPFYLGLSCWSPAWIIPVWQPMQGSSVTKNWFV